MAAAENTSNLSQKTAEPPIDTPLIAATQKTLEPNASKSANQSENEQHKGSIKIIGKNTVKCGKSYKYKINMSGISAKVKWSINNRKLAVINKSGKLKAIKNGKLILTAKVKKYKCTLKIKIS